MLDDKYGDPLLLTYLRRGRPTPTASTDRSASGVSCASSSSLYTTAPAHAGGGLYQRLGVSNAKDVALNPSESRRPCDLEAYYQLRNKFGSDRRTFAEEPCREATPVDTTTTYRAALVNAAAEKIVARYQPQLHPTDRHLTTTTNDMKRGETKDSSPDSLRHRTLLQTVAPLFGTNNTSAAALSPRSWQDDVLRNVSSLSHQARGYQRRDDDATSEPCDVSWASQSHAFLYAPAADEDTDDFLCADPVSEQDHQYAESTRQNAVVVAPSSLIPSTSKFCDEGATRSPASLPDNTEVSVAPPETKNNNTRNATRLDMLSEVINDETIMSGIESIHARMAVVRSVMARQALEHVEEGSRRDLVKQATAFFHEVFLFFDEEVSRSTIVAREASVRCQATDSLISVIRRNSVQKKIMEDWVTAEFVERKRLMHQRDLFASSMEGPISQLRRIWEPQQRLLTSESESRRVITQQGQYLVHEMYLICLELSEELHRRQLLTARDAMQAMQRPFPHNTNARVNVVAMPSPQQDSSLLGDEEVMLITAQDAYEYQQQKHNRIDTSLLGNNESASEDAVSGPLEWSKFFLQTTAPLSSSARFSDRHPHRVTAKRTPNLPLLQDTAASRCSVCIRIPIDYWVATSVDSMILNRLTSSSTYRNAAKNIEADLTLVDYFAMWRPILKLLFEEGASRMQIRDAALLKWDGAFMTALTSPLSSLEEIVLWHYDCVRHIGLSEQMRHLLSHYLDQSECYVQEEAIARGALFGYFAAWKSRCAFMEKLIEAEDESWEQTLHVARANAIGSRSNSATSDWSRQAESVAIQADLPFVPFPTAPSASHSMQDSMNVSTASLPSVKGATPPQAPLHFDFTSFDTAREMSNVAATLLAPSQHTSAAQHLEAIKKRPVTLTDELFSLADVTATGHVKLPNAAAALRLRQICFDLPLIAQCFQRACHIYDEMTGHNDVHRTQGGGNVAVVSSSSASLNREAFELMIQILMNTLKSRKQLSADLLERWEYERRHAR